MAIKHRIDSDTARRRQIVNTCNAVHLLAVRMDATPEQADGLRNLAAAMMRGRAGRPADSGAMAYARCAKLASVTLGRGPIYRHLQLVA